MARRLPRASAVVAEERRSCARTLASTVADDGRRRGGTLTTDCEKPSRE
ncbi:hypothetical protein [Halalkalicoccus salilacus]